MAGVRTAIAFAQAGPTGLSHVPSSLCGHPRASVLALPAGIGPLSGLDTLKRRSSCLGPARHEALSAS